MRQLTLILALGIATGTFGVRSLQIEERLGDVESRSRSEKREIEVLRTRLLEAQTDLARSHRSLAALEREMATGAKLEETRNRLESELSRAHSTIEAHATRLDACEETVNQRVEPNWESSFEDLRTSLDEKWNDFGGGMVSTQALAQENRTHLERLNRLLERDTEVLWHNVMGPTVQLSGETTVGSGVLLESQPHPDGEGYQTYVLTAWHVVRDILADAEVLEGPIPIIMYDVDGATTDFTGDLLRFDPDIDIALLELDSREAVPFGARLAPRSRLESMKTFANVYAAGCPLGNDPIPTFGEIADTRHVVDGDHYWMISAPTYVGNSGGGIFDASNHELIGIFSKIYTHGTLRPTVVPHMGLSTPLAVVYDWLEQVGYEEIVGLSMETNTQTASAAVGDSE